MGSGDKNIPRRVAESLKLELFDNQKLKDKALKMGIPIEDLKGLDEKAPGFFDRFLSTKTEAYLDLMKSVVYEVSRDGNGVVIGHGSQILLRDFGCALHVLIHSSDTARVQNISKGNGISRESAEKLIHKSDNERKGFFRFAFNMSWDDPSLYDLIINPEKIGIEVSIKLIIEAANSEEIKTCSLTALETMEKLSQEKLIRAALLKSNINLSSLHLEVPTKGVALISGFTESDGDKQRIIGVVKAVPGISEVQPEIAVVEVYGE